MLDDLAMTVVLIVSSLKSKVVVLTSHTRNLFQKFDFVEGKDFLVEYQSLKKTVTHRYLMTPLAFKKLLLCSDRYANYFILLEKCVYL